MVLLASLIVATTYWQSWAVGGLNDRQDNAIQQVAQLSIARGPIVGANGGKTVFAANTSRSAWPGRRSSRGATRRRGSPRRSSATRPTVARAPGSSSR